MRRRRPFLALYLALGVLPLRLYADMPSPVAVAVSAEPSRVPPGGSFWLTVTFEIQEGWHIYGVEAGEGPVSTSVVLAGPDGFEALGPVREPEPVVSFDAGFERPLPKHEGRVTLRLPVRAAENVPPGEHGLAVEVTYQPCTETTCLRASTRTHTVAITVDPAAAPAPMPDVEAATPPRAPPPPAPGTGPSEAEVSLYSELQASADEGLVKFLLTAAIVGFASLLTPCVFPMIPITISLFVKRGERGQGSPLVAASAYGAAIILTYTLLGLLLAATWGASGARRLGADPWLNLGLGALFVVLALNLFGLFEIRLPQWLTNAASRGQARGGLLGVMFMGLAFTLTSFTCTVAFVGFLLAQASQGEWLWPGLGMLVFSTCFALPFFLLALFPQLMTRLPSAGSWLHMTKVLMGFLELAAALKFLSNADLVWDWQILRNGPVLGAWTIIALFMTLYVIGVLRLSDGGAERAIGVGRMMLGMATGLLTLTLAVGVFGGPLPVWIATYLPEPRQGELEWLLDLDEGLAQARASNRPVFVDFTGYTCTNCRQMEIEVFPSPEVQELLRRYVRVKLFTDDREDGERWARLQEERFGTSALPFYVLLTPRDEVIDTRAGMVRPARAFAAFLRAGLERAV